jgi:glycosyltransferase involved in cell wall biosynthesis
MADHGAPEAEPGARIAIMDPGLAGRLGHHFDQDFRIARALRALGREVEVHAVANAAAELTAAFAAIGVPLHRTFRANAYHRPAPADDTWEHWQARVALTAQDLAAVAPADVAFWPSLTPAHFLALTATGHGRRIVGGLDGHINYATPLGAELLASGRAAAQALGGRLALGAYDRFIVDAYRPILAGLPIARLPVPYDGHCTPPAATLSRVGFFGHQRGERGARLIPELIEALVVRGLKVTIQDSGGRIALRQPHPDIAVLGYVDDFAAALADCDLIVWPSGPEHYAARTSGVVWEAIASGRPVVVPSGCLPAQIAYHDGAATFFHQATAASVLRAIDEAVEQYGDLARRADRMAQRWRATEGTAHLAAALVAPRLPHWSPA